MGAIALGGFIVNSLNAIFEHTADAVFGTDNLGRVRFWNKRCEELLGISHRQAIGRPCHELVCGRDLLGNEFCGDKCQVRRFYDRNKPNNNLDLVLKQKAGGDIVVNVGSYYMHETSNDEKGVRVYHSMRTVDCHQFIRRLALNSATSNDAPANVNRLSKRELEVLRLVSSGAKTREIAEQLVISHATVRNHMKNIYTKLEVHSQAEAISCAMRHGLV